MSIQEPETRAPTDVELVKGAAGGEREAFACLLSRHYDRLYALAWRLTGSSAEAEDLTQDICLALPDKLIRFDGRAAFTTWLYRVAVNAATDWLKKKRQDRAIQLDDFGAMSLADDADGPDQNVRTKDLRKEVRMAMGELPEKFRTILVLRELEGLQYEEISAVLQISKGTVESRIFRARAKLKIELERRRLGA